MFVLYQTPLSADKGNERSVEHRDLDREWRTSGP